MIGVPKLILGHAEKFKISIHVIFLIAPPERDFSWLIHVLNTEIEITFALHVQLSGATNTSPAIPPIHAADRPAAGLGEAVDIAI